MQTQSVGGLVTCVFCLQNAFKNRFLSLSDFLVPVNHCRDQLDQHTLTWQLKNPDTGKDDPGGGDRDK
jgi:hypothetical protein